MIKTNSSLPFFFLVNHQLIVCEVGRIISVHKTIKIIIFLLPLPVLICAVVLGAYRISLHEIVTILFAFITHDNAIQTTQAYRVLFSIRLPRIFLAILAGTAFSVSGCIFQSLFMNPLVDSYILGISSGAAFGAALALAFIPIPVQMAAFICGFAAVAISFLSIRNTNSDPTIALVLTGTMVSAIFSAFLWIIQFMVDPVRLQSIVYWMMGSFHTASWDKVTSAASPILICLSGAMLLRWNLNVLSMGEGEAQTMGINTKRDTILLILIATVLSTSAVAVCGIIGLVGLVVPHILRMVFGPDNTKLIPLSILIGATYLLGVDTLARNISSFEIPVGIITTFIGAPFFILLLRHTKDFGWSN